MQMIRLVVILALAASLAASSRGVLSEWSPATFPDPTSDWKACGRSVRSHVCDPDGLLSEERKNVLDGKLMDIQEGADPFVRHKCGDELVGYQVAVAVMKKMAVPPGADAASAARKFAKALHDRWGVGHGACSDGVLLLLASEDRQVYISTGPGSKKALPDSEVSRIIELIKPRLRSGDYGAAMEQAVTDVGLALAGRELPEPEGEPWDWFGLLFFGGVAAFVGGQFWRARRRRRQYSECKRVLEKLKREQEEIRRRHAWSRPQSCPICFEDFPPVQQGGPSGPGGLGASSSTGAKAEVEQEGYEEEASPSAPLLPRDASGIDLSPEASAAAAAAAEAAAAAVPSACGHCSSSKGDKSSSGAGPSTSSAAAGTSADPEHTPISLACGHTFCERCMESWLEKGTTCPVCRKPIAEDDAPPPPGPSSTSAQRRQQWRSSSEAQQQRLHRQRIDDDWATQDLLFRLHMLRLRYPGYITADMVDQWGREARTRGTFEWNSRDFQLNDPGLRHQQHDRGSSGWSGGSSGGFGGGRSYGGGGAGGSW